jgi:uncharacterized protein with von Willebrand factor type A (vWA) domain
MTGKPGFDARSLQRNYAFVERCPAELLPVVTTLPLGSFQERVECARAWWDALLRGEDPPVTPWPPPAIAAPARQALAKLGIARFCKERPELVAELLRNVFESFRRGAEALQREIAEELRRLEELERQRPDAAEAAAAIREKRPTRPRTLTQATRDRLRSEAEQLAMASVRAPDSELVAEWQERVRVWSEITAVFDDLGSLLGRGYDLSRAVLKHAGWADLLRWRQLLEHLPQLREIVQSLGRLQAGRGEPSVAERVFVPVRRVEEERRVVDTPLVPMETRGVERSGEVARMLPAEAVMLGHPKLRMLWHARRAECSLVTYRVEGTEDVVELVEQTGTEAREQRRPRPERGPIVVVLDTSGSMHGLPATVAKALVLEAVRTAHAEKRRCLLYSYSGPQNVLEHELDLSSDGITRLLEFLGYTFGGGNDETGVMTRVVDRLKQNDWKRADVLFVSDGEWPAPAQLVAKVGEAKAIGTRFHGVQIGNRGHTGLHEVCDPVHVFQGWAAAAGW